MGFMEYVKSNDHLYANLWNFKNWYEIYGIIYELYVFVGWLAVSCAYQAIDLTIGLNAEEQRRDLQSEDAERHRQSMAWEPSQRDWWSVNGYPLVNVYIAMENHHFYSIFSMGSKKSDPKTGHVQ